MRYLTKKQIYNFFQTYKDLDKLKYFKVSCKNLRTLMEICFLQKKNTDSQSTTKIKYKTSKVVMDDCTVGPWHGKRALVWIPAGMFLFLCSSHVCMCVLQLAPTVQKHAL